MRGSLGNVSKTPSARHRHKPSVTRELGRDAQQAAARWSSCRAVVVRGRPSIAAHDRQVQRGRGPARRTPICGVFVGRGVEYPMMLVRRVVPRRASICCVIAVQLVWCGIKGPMATALACLSYEQEPPTYHRSEWTLRVTWDTQLPLAKVCTRTTMSEA